MLNSFLDTLDPESCAVFLGRYYYSYSIAELAKQYAFSSRQVKYRLSKIRKQLFLYEDSSFQFNGSVELEKFGTADFRFRCAVKGSFDDAVPFFYRDEGDEEWQYTSVYGEPLLLVLDSSRTLIFADFNECCITVSVLSGRNEGMTKEDLQSSTLTATEKSDMVRLIR